MNEVKILRFTSSEKLETEINALLKTGYKLDTNFKIENDGTQFYALMFK
ncbi:hypothetical protein [Psychroflexus salis]|uniref:DUF1737 domain-containing protein n=1 Tax=Psychroflexus salis TaxID=1526574 RepID=A0A916ZSN8_9FLAO|nr:hypothetical protein [Psychroflexus salis]GGE12029.1 hypothetical protein GCM10010831_11840 [Psychroflexus salis]